MSGVFEVEDKITEQEFEAMIRGKALDIVDREAMRKHYGLPCNETLLSRFGMWKTRVIIAFQKLRGNPFVL